ncbi:MAG: CBS domain-containing protein, partial [Candidatus Scalindua sp.]|nr:CBS domain-containing protein [Candidatus Scalindua sp.]
DLNNIKISELMTSPVVTSTDDIDLHEAYDILLSNKIRHFVVVDTRGEIVRVVSQADIANALEAEYFLELRKISCIMSKNVISVDKKISAMAAIDIMAAKTISCIVVEEEGYPIGILSESDITRLILDDIDLKVITIVDVMKHPVCTIGVDASVHEAVIVMKQNDFRRLIVIGNDGKTEGLVTHSDIVRGMTFDNIQSLKAIIYEKDKQLHEKSVYLNNILRSSTNDAIITIGLDYQITYYNPMAEVIYGYRAVEVVGKKVQDVFKKDNLDIKSLELAIENILKTGEYVYTLEKDADGSICYIEARVSGISDQDGKLIGYANFSRDVSPRKQYERKLIFQEKAEKLVSDISSEFIKRDTNEVNSVINNSLCKIGEFAEADRAYVFQLYENGTKVNNTHEWCNNAIQPLIKMSHELLVDMFPQWWMEKLKRFEAIHIPREFSNSQESNVGKNFIESQDFQSLIVLPMVVKGSLIGFVGFESVREEKVWSDFFVNLLGRIGELFANALNRKQIEGALIQSEKLKSIGTITAGISHEFNNLLAVISGNVELLEEAYKHDKVLTNLLRTIMKATDDGAEITSSMLKFTKTKQDVKGIVYSDIRAMIMHSIEFTKPRWKNEAQARGIHYKIDTKRMNSIPSMMCKPSEMREIFINIITNALDAMPEGGTISFSTFSNSHTLFVCIADTGEGMSENVQRNIFDPFFSTKGVEGTGLGMSLVYGIVTRYGGKIDVNSEIGNGTTFTLQFPIANKKTSSKEISEPKQEAGKKNLRILVVDDEEDIRNILNKFLSRKGHNVKVVDNGAYAIKMLEGEEFDLVLCDLAMPNVSGYDVVRVLNKLKKRPKIGIITGWAREPDTITDTELNVDFYLNKPFKLLEITTHINDVFAMDNK